MAASILGVCSHLPSLAALENAWRADAQIQTLVEQDRSYDGSEEITKEWLTAVVAQFQKRGLLLTPPGQP